MTGFATPLSMPQRAAIVLAQLDDDRAQRVLASLSEDEVVAIMSEMASLPTIRTEDVEQVIAEFADAAGALLQVRQGGTELAQRWLRERLGLARSAEVMAELRSHGQDQPLMFLNRIEPQQIVGFLGDEHPQTIALMLANMNPEHAARVIEIINEDVRVDVARRMASLGAVPSDAIEKVATELHSRLSAFAYAGGQAQMGGIPSVVALLNSSTGATERQILSGLEQSDPDLAERIRAGMFRFDDVMGLDDVTLQTALRSVPRNELALALKGKPQQMLEKVTHNVSTRAAEDLLEDLSALGPQRLSAVEAAEAHIVMVVRELADSGEITIGRGNDALVG